MRDDLDSSINTARRIAKILDEDFGIGRFKIGLDPIIGLLPVAGDTITLLLSSYIVLTAYKYDLPRMTKLRMMANMFIDYIIGMIPVFGDIFDAAYKANMRNLRLLENHLNEKK